MASDVKDRSTFFSGGRINVLHCWTICIKFRPREKKKKVPAYCI